MKKLLILLISAALLSGLYFLNRDVFPGWEAPDILTAAQSRAIQKDLTRIAEACRDAGNVDAMESKLADMGFAVVDTDGVYPACLANAGELRAFAEKDIADAAVLQVNDDGSLFHMFFSKGKEDFLVLTKVSSSRVVETEVLPLYEMELMAGELFYYRCYPADDPHYSDYSFFRLTPADRELYDLTRQYILPVGYRMVNLFLCDWSEGDWGNLSFNDVFAYLYELQTNTVFPWQIYPVDNAGYCRIPAGLFERTLLSYFSVSLETLRLAARYDETANTYPWRAVHGDDLTAWEIPDCQPEVTAWKENPSGTLTLTVRVACPDRKTNELFTHEVTVRPLESGGFQYVGNKVIYVNKWGLPPGMKRFALDEGIEGR